MLRACWRSACKRTEREGSVRPLPGPFVLSFHMESQNNSVTTVDGATHFGEGFSHHGSPYSPVSRGFLNASSDGDAVPSPRHPGQVGRALGQQWAWHSAGRMEGPARPQRRGHDRVEASYTSSPTGPWLLGTIGGSGTNPHP